MILENPSLGSPLSSLVCNSINWYRLYYNLKPTWKNAGDCGVFHFSVIFDRGDLNRTFGTQYPEPLPYLRFMPPE
jgi:hypothetical protein